MLKRVTSKNNNQEATLAEERSLLRERQGGAQSTILRKPQVNASTVNASTVNASTVNASTATAVMPAQTTAAIPAQTTAVMPAQ